MYELKNDAFYALIPRYPDCAVDYFIIKNNAPYIGEDSHREAMRIAMQKMSVFEYDLQMARLNRTDADAAVCLPDAPYKKTIKYKDGTDITTFDKSTGGGRITYAQAFLMPPHGSAHTPSDFNRIDAVLFPHGTRPLIAYEWSDDWSDYFDDGHEWWGVFCMTFYDPIEDRFIIIMASQTD